jgi:hypothetical protein
MSSNNLHLAHTGRWHERRGLVGALKKNVRMWDFDKMRQNFENNMKSKKVLKNRKILKKLKMMRFLTVFYLKNLIFYS